MGKEVATNDIIIPDRAIIDRGSTLCKPLVHIHNFMHSITNRPKHQAPTLQTRPMHPISTVCRATPTPRAGESVICWVIQCCRVGIHLSLLGMAPVLADNGKLRWEGRPYSSCCSWVARMKPQKRAPRAVSFTRLQLSTSPFRLFPSCMLPKYRTVIAQPTTSSTAVAEHGSSYTERYR